MVGKLTDHEVGAVFKSGHDTLFTERGDIVEGEKCEGRARASSGGFVMHEGLEGGKGVARRRRERSLHVGGAGVDGNFCSRGCSFWRRSTTLRAHLKNFSQEVEGGRYLFFNDRHGIGQWSVQQRLHWNAILYR